MRVAVIGVGYWGPNLVRALLELGQEVVVHDRRPERMRAIEERFAVTSATTLEEIWTDHTIEAVCIAVPLPEHASLLRQACLAGKHVFVEKPLCANAAEAEGLRRHLNGKTVMVGHITRFSPALEMFWRQLAGGAVGRLCSISLSRTHFGPVYAETDVLTEVAAHDFAILLTIRPDAPSSIAAWGVSRRGNGAPDRAHVVLTWPDGLIATVDVGWTSVFRQRRVVAEGTAATLLFDASSGREQVSLYRQESALASLAGGASPRAAADLCLLEDLTPEGGEPLRIELASFLEAIAQRRRPATDFEFGARVVGLLDAARTSLHQGSREVRLDEAYA